MRNKHAEKYFKGTWSRVSWWIQKKIRLQVFSSKKSSVNIRAYNQGCSIGMYFLTFIFLLLYKAIQQNIECKIIWKNSILNLKKRRKKVQRANVLFKSSQAQRCRHQKEQNHGTAHWCNVQSSNTRDQHGSCDVGPPTSDALHLFWHFTWASETRNGIAYHVIMPPLHLACFGHPTLFKNKKLSGKKEYLKAVKRL